jgi:trehalose 6-phosphate phosphatase
MRYVLTRKSEEAVRRFLASPVLLAFDFDGTLAPIVGDPDRARLRPATRRLLRRVAEAWPCVVISGRSRADVRNKLFGTGIRRTFGNHGAEPWADARRARKQVARWGASLAKDLANLSGIRIDNHRLSVTVHYRHCDPRASARSQILDAARMLPEARLICGKLAVSVIPARAPNKGTALRAELARLACDRALYVGDDETDEDVFALDRGIRLLSVRVGRKHRSRAQYFLRNQAEIDEFLRILIASQPV